MKIGDKVVALVGKYAGYEGIVITGPMGRQKTMIVLMPDERAVVLRESEVIIKGEGLRNAQHVAEI